MVHMYIRRELECREKVIESRRKWGGKGKSLKRPRQNKTVIVQKDTYAYACMHAYIYAYIYIYI